MGETIPERETLVPVSATFLSAYQLFQAQNLINMQRQLNLTFKDIKLTVSTPAKEGIDLGTKNYARPGVDANLTSHRIFDFFLLSKKWGYLLRPHFSQPRRECKSGFCNREWRHWGQPGAQVPFFSVNLSPSLICIRASLCVAAFYKLDGPQAGWEKIRSPPWCKQ